jgi:putative ABC transport system permease protein
MNLEGFESMHQGWGMGISPKALKSAAASLPEPASAKELQPVNLSAVWVGLHNRADVFSVKRKIESLSRDPLMAILPGVALDELWQVVKIVENSMVVIGAMVSVSAMLSVAAVLLVAMSGRRKELAILRAMGAAPRALMGFVLIESVMVCFIGIVSGYVISQFLIVFSQDMLRTGYGVVVQPGLPSSQSLFSMGALFVVSVLASLLPAWRAYSLSLIDGLHPPSV